MGWELARSVAEKESFIAPVSFDVVKLLFILAVFSTSFDIFLVFNLGFNFRVSQVFLLVPIMYAVALFIMGRVTWPFGFVPLLVWVCFILIFIPNTDFVLRSVGYGLWLIFSVLLIFAAVQIFNTYPKVLLLVQWYLYSFVFVAAFGLFQFVSPALGLGEPLIQQWWFPGVLPRINGFSYEPSYFATYLVMGWVVCMYLLKHRSSLMGRQQLWFISAFIALAIVLSSSRMGWIVMALWFAQYPALFFIRLLKGRLHKRFFIYSIIIFSIVALMVSSMLFVLGKDRIAFLLAGIGLMGESAHSVVERSQNLADVFAIFLKSPVIGYSLGGLSSAIGNLHGVDVSDLELAKLYEGNAVFPQVLAASGIVGFIPFMLYVILLIQKPYRLARKAFLEQSKLLRAMVWALIFEFLILQLNQNILRVYLWMHIAILSALYHAVILDISRHCGSEINKGVAGVGVIR